MISKIISYFRPRPLAPSVTAALAAGEAQARRWGQDRARTTLIPLVIVVRKRQRKPLLKGSPAIAHSPACLMISSVIRSDSQYPFARIFANNGRTALIKFARLASIRTRPVPTT